MKKMTMKEFDKLYLKSLYGCSGWKSKNKDKVWFCGLEYNGDPKGPELDILKQWKKAHAKKSLLPEWGNRGVPKKYKWIIAVIKYCRNPEKNKNIEYKGALNDEDLAEEEYKNYPIFNLYPLPIPAGERSKSKYSNFVLKKIPDFKNIIDENKKENVMYEYKKYCIDHRRSIISRLVKRHKPRHIVLCVSNEYDNAMKLFTPDGYETKGKDDSSGRIIKSENGDHVCKLWITGNWDMGRDWEWTQIGIEIGKSINNL